MSEEMQCPKCNKLMENLGNIDNKIMCSYPPCWYETYVCHECKVKKRILRRGEIPPDFSFTNDYKEVNDK